MMRKKPVFTFIYITLFLMSGKATAAFLTTYDDLKKTKLFTEPHLVAYVDTITKKGGGLFSWVAGDVQEEIIGLVIKPERIENIGSWIRQDVTSLHADWFGAVNKKSNFLTLPPTFKTFGYTLEEIRNRYGKYIPDISLEDTPDWAALQLMCRLQELGWHAIELNSESYYVNRTVVLPGALKANFVVHYAIEGNGATLNNITDKGFSFLFTIPENQKQGEGYFAARRFTIKNLIIRGSSNKPDVGINIGATFHTLLENIQLHGLDTGIVLRHAMSSIISRCNAVGCDNISYYLGSGRGAWEGATSSNSGSNQSKIISCRQFTADGQFAGIYVTESSECSVEDFTLDGSGKRHTRYGIYIDTRGVSTVKDGLVNGVHAEAAVDSALIKFRGNGNALFEVGRLYVQYTCTLVELEVPANYAQVNCSNFIYFPSESTFANKGAGKWNFNNVFGKSKQINWKKDAGYSIPEVKQVEDKRKL